MIYELTKEDNSKVKCLVDFKKAVFEILCSCLSVELTVMSKLRLLPTCIISLNFRKLAPQISKY